MWKIDQKATLKYLECRLFQKNETILVLIMIKEFMINWINTSNLGLQEDEDGWD